MCLETLSDRLRDGSPFTAEDEESSGSTAATAVMVENGRSTRSPIGDKSGCGLLARFQLQLLDLEADYLILRRDGHDRDGWPRPTSSLS